MTYSGPVRPKFFCNFITQVIIIQKALLRLLQIFFHCQILLFMSTSRKRSNIVLIDGCRTPFQIPGTGYRSFRSRDLARFAIRGLLNRTKIAGDQIGRVIMGTAFPDTETGNLAREAALGAGLPASVPAHTVSMSCLSSQQAIAGGIGQILSGGADVVIAGGADSFSSVRRPEELPLLREVSTGETMGKWADRLADRLGVSREEQDAYAVRSHQSAVKANESRLLDDELIPVASQPGFEAVTRDNGFRADFTPESLSILKPAFTKKHGTVTTGNAFFPADGASAVLIMTEEKAAELGLTPRVRIASRSWTAAHPADDMLTGAAHAIPKLIEQSGINPGDIDVFEVHEAFAVQIIALLKALASSPVPLPLRSLNPLGGSLSLGHPFGATGGRLLTTAANRLTRGNGRYAVVASPGGGGHGHAMLLEAMDAGSGNKSARGASSRKTTTQKAASRKSSSSKATGTRTSASKAPSGKTEKTEGTQRSAGKASSGKAGESSSGKSQTKKTESQKSGPKQSGTPSSDNQNTAS